MLNHSKLFKRIWTIGNTGQAAISDYTEDVRRPVKLPDKTIIHPTKGTPQGGILSPLLSNIVLNELGWWVSSSWENMPTRYEYYTSTKENGTVCRSGAMEALRKTNVKKCVLSDMRMISKSFAEATTLRSGHFMR